MTELFAAEPDYGWRRLRGRSQEVNGSLVRMLALHHQRYGHEAVQRSSLAAAMMMMNYS